MKTITFYICMLTVITFLACNKDKVTVPQNLDGTYTGVLNWQNTAGFITQSTAATNTQAQVVITGKTYQASINTAYGAASRGSFMIDGNLITFTDSTAHTANFDWGLLLNGVYASTLKGDSLILVKKGTAASYTYRLKKQ